jgi:excisionase family DNA binding protein
MPEMQSKDQPPRLVYDVVEAGKMLGLTRGGSYLAAARGDIPTIRIGRLLRVPRAAFHRMLEAAGAEANNHRKNAALPAVGDEAERRSPKAAA